MVIVFFRLVDNNLIDSKRFSAEAKFVKLPEYRDANIVMCYVSTKEEADSWWLLQKVLQDDKTLVVPRVDGDIMEFYIINDLKQLQQGKFGIFEPQHNCELYVPQGNELMAVPGVNFDEECNRKGHGRGYYDKYFGKYGKNNFYKVALTMESQIVSHLENVQDHDVKMDIILTEDRIIIASN